MHSIESDLLRNLIPFVPQLKETFFNWATLDDYNRNQLKFIVDRVKKMKIKPIISALEQWDDLQNYGAPGVESESIVCDDNTLHEVMESSLVLNKIILKMMAQIKNADHSI